MIVIESFAFCLLHPHKLRGETWIKIRAMASRKQGANYLCLLRISKIVFWINYGVSARAEVNL